MKIKHLITIVIITLFSCQGKPEKGYIEENFALKNIQKGMTRKEVIEKIGMPKDSVDMYNSESAFRKIYSYETNNFSGYSLKIIFNDKDIVDDISID